MAMAGGPGRSQSSAWMGRVVIEWLQDGRRFRLLEEFAFVDASGEVWRVSKGTEVEGSCFPSQFTRFLGHPFSGPQRRAAVVYEVSCQKRERGWREVQRMFHEAVLLDGVTPVEAKVMYFALFNFGRRWGTTPSRAISTDNDFLRGARYIRMHSDITLSAIERLSPAALRQQ